MKSVVVSRKSIVWEAALALVLLQAAAWANPFADSVVSYNPGPGQFVLNPMFNDPARCLGAPVGLYVDEPDNTSCATLGDGGSITLAFNEPVYDDPANPYGLDFIVFSNCQFVGASPTYRWQELAFVEISQDGSTWYLILPSKLPADLVGGVDTGQSATVVSGYAEYTPTVGLPQDLELPEFKVTRTAEELYTVPERPSVPGDPGTIAFDYVSGGGDALDIASAVVETARGVPAMGDDGKPIPAGIGWFRYVRITDAVTGDRLGQLNEISAEIDAVSAIRPALSIGQAKRRADGDYVLITDAVVTGAFFGGFFIESPDRSAALKVISDRTVSPGDRLTITGHISKGAGFVLPDTMFSVTGSVATPKPLGISIPSLNSDLACGLLVRTWGRVIDDGDGLYCVISDGGRRCAVVCDDYFYAPLDSYVSVTGVCDRDPATGDTIVRLLDMNSITQH